jgi:hypothetical protein
MLADLLRQSDCNRCISFKRQEICFLQWLRHLATLTICPKIWTS